MSEAELVDQNHSTRIIESEFLHSHIFGTDSPRIQKYQKMETTGQTEKNSSSPSGTSKVKGQVLRGEAVKQTSSLEHVYGAQGQD